MKMEEIFKSRVHICSDDRRKAAMGLNSLIGIFLEEFCIPGVLFLLFRYCSP